MPLKDWLRVVFQVTDLSVYIHYPFCESKCPYCDFNSHVRGIIDADKWLAAYLKELEYFADRLPSRRVISIFFGGGTPSLMPVKTVEKIIEKISDIWGVSDNIEITLEANPTSFEVGKFIGFKSAGVNRVSIGVQSLEENRLKFLGRKHNINNAIYAIENAAKIFKNYSFDLIYATPEQSIDEWKSELNEALKLAGNHLSLYQLTIEKGTPFYSAEKNKKFLMPSEVVSAEMYEITGEIMEKHNMPAYEISNYAVNGFKSRHNLTYWNYGEYLGIGAGSHSRLKSNNGREAIMMLHSPEKWLESVDDNGHGTQVVENIEGDELVSEIIMMGLRVFDGISVSNFKEITGENIYDILPANKIAAFVENGFILSGENSLRVTKKGSLVLGAIIEGLL